MRRLTRPVGAALRAAPASVQPLYCFAAKIGTPNRVLILPRDRDEI